MTPGAEKAQTTKARPVGAAPERTCLATGRAMPQSALLRFVVGPGDEVVPDLDGRLPGRGLWLSAERDMVQTACAKGLFAKGARRKVTVPADLAERVETLMARRCLEGLGLARRAGDAVAGFEKVRAWLGAGRVALVVAAADGGRDGAAKIARLAGDVPVFVALDADALGPVMGRDRAVHVALAKGGLAKHVARELTRLQAYRGAGPEANFGPKLRKN